MKKKRLALLLTAAMIFQSSALASAGELFTAGTAEENVFTAGENFTEESALASANAGVAAEQASLPKSINIGVDEDIPVNEFYKYVKNLQAVVTYENDSTETFGSWEVPLYGRDFLYTLDSSGQGFYVEITDAAGEKVFMDDVNLPPYGSYTVKMYSDDLNEVSASKTITIKEPSTVEIQPGGSYDIPETYQTEVYYGFTPAEAGTYTFYMQAGTANIYLYSVTDTGLEYADRGIPQLTWGLQAETSYVYRLKTYGACTAAFCKGTEPQEHIHAWDEGNVTKEPTCAAEGEKTYTCKECKDTKKETIPKTEIHIWDSGTVTKAATCAEPGTKTYTCTGCRTTRTEELPKLGEHTWEEWKTLTEATVFAPEKQQHKCTVCGLTEERENGTKLTGTLELNVKTLPLKAGQTTNKVKVSGLVAGDAVESWTSASNAIARVDKNGKITGVKPGRTTVTVTLASGAKKGFTVIVQKKAVKTAKISGLSRKVTLTKGKKERLNPVILPLTSQEKVTYATSDSKIAVVSKRGVITAKKAGTARITVKSGSKRQVVTVTVKNPAPSAIKGIPAAKTLRKGKTFTLRPRLYPAGAEGKITYKSSSAKTVSVDKKGKITARKKGTAVITVTAGRIKKTCKITVK